MKAMYCEIERNRRFVRVNIYSGAEDLERSEERWARRRRRMHIRELAGAVIGFTGFLLLMGIDGPESMCGMAALGCTGLGLLVLGAWLGHAFYGQEDKAEWLRRMRERGEIE